MTSIMDESLFGGRTKSIEDIAKKFGVTMRQKKPPFSITRSSRYSKTQSMSFLESSTNPESQSRIIVREFKDPFCFSSSSQQENNNKASLVPSRNKWTSNDLTSYKRRSVNVDTNNNTNSRKHLSSNRNSSCTISFDELHGGRDEINTISEKDKPILKLWAQKNKSNAAVKDANRSSYLGSPNDAKKVLGQISGTPWGKYLKTNSRKDTMTESNKQDSRSTARRSDIMITTRSVRKGPQVETKVRPKSAYYEKTTIESLQKREIPIDIDDKNPMQNPSKDVNNNNNRTKALKRSSKIIIRSNSTAKEPPAPSVKTVIRTNSTATLDNKHVKVERKDSAERPKVNTTSDRADHKENVAISSSINNSKELLESEQAENTKHCRTASVDSSEPEQNQDIETREQSNTGNKPTPPKTLAKPKPPSSKKTVEYHNSFLDDLDDLESEIDQQLMGTNKQPPPPVPRRSSSKTSELTDFLKKLNDQEEKSSTPKLTRATTLTSPSTTTVITTATMTSTINSVITQNLSRTLPPTTTTTPSNEQEQKTTSNDNVEEKQSFKDTLAEYDVISSQSDEASENEAVKSNNIDPPNETYVDVEETEDQTSPSKDENDTTTTSQDTQEPKQKFSRFSLKKKKSVDQTPALPSSPKQEPKQRKHSLTHVFSKHKKEKDDITSPTSPLSPNEDSPITSPTHNKERRGSAFSRLFSHKKHDQPEPSKEEKKTSKKTTSEKVKAPVEDVPKTPTKQPSPELDATSPNTSLSIPGANLNGSSESLYSDNDYGEPSTRRSSRNKERIRNRKLAKKEAAERHKSLPAGLEELQIDLEKGLAVPVSNNNTITGKESPSVTDATPRTRKKHRARRSNTEFLGNVPLISVEQASPLISKDDATVNRRNNRRNRRDRPKTLMNGLDSDVFNQGDENGGNEVVNENLSFSDIKKKLLEGLTDDKKIPEKVSSKERQKIKRTKSTKRYKTITEGIAPRDLELARQAIEAEKSKTDENGTSRNTIDKSTLDQITAALTSTGDKRKSFIVESRPASRYQSNEDLRISDDEDDKKSKDDSVIKPPATSRRMLQRTKSMTTLHLDTKAEVDADEPEIKPLSELKNRFLQAMEDTQQKHVNYKQSPVEVRRRARRDRKDRPHTICGIDQLTMGQLNDDKKEQEEKDNHRMEQIKNEINEVKQREEADRQARKEALTRPRRGSLEEKPKKREKKKYTRAQSEKIFNDIDDDLEDLLADGLNESDLADILGVNPSLAKDPFIPKAKKELDLEIKGNAEIKKAEEPVKPTKTELEPEEPVVNGTTNGEPLSDLDFVSSKSSQLSSSLANDKRKLRPNRKQRSGANPMKSLQNRDDLINEVAVADKQKEQRMNKIDLQSKFLRKNDLADEAISALRATVDFSKTKLRKVEVNKKTMADDVLDESFKPTEFENVLIQVK
uniref:Uncharacterized protein n=1 Tax=Clytia hemisphaerica TaxID=252671 RepID=A0A7M5V7A8_9CNID